MTIAKDTSATLEAIKICIGKTIAGISRVQYFFNETEDKDGFGDLEITFTDNSFLTLSGAGDDVSIRATNKRSDIAESLKVADNNVCSWKRLDLNDDVKWKTMISQTLKSAEVKWNPTEKQDEKLVACILKFDKDFISFYETGWDSNKFFINTAPSIVDEETRSEKIK